MYFVINNFGSEDAYMLGDEFITLKKTDQKKIDPIKN